MVCKLQTSLGFRYGSGRPLAGNPASSSDCLTSLSSNPLSEEVIYIYMLLREDRRPSLSERSGSAIREDCCAHSQSFHFAPFESSLRRSNIYIYAARRGFEPRTTAPKTGVLPLHHRASCFRISPLLYGLFFYFFYSFCFFSFFGSCYRCGCFLLFILY